MPLPHSLSQPVNKEIMVAQHPQIRMLDQLTPTVSRF
jgi:hypothetical protein